MIAAAYVRVSTEEQAREGFSLPAQLRAARERAIQDGARIDHEFVDEGLSGSRSDRPEYQKMLALAAEGRFQILYVWTFDRLNRDAEEALRARRMLEAAGVRLVSVTEGTSDSTLIYGVRALIAQEERERIAQRTRAGKAAAARRGRPNGGPRRYGFTQTSGVLVPKPDEIRIVERIFREYVAGSTQTQIARDLNFDGHRTAQGKPWNQSRLSHLLRDAIWVGKIRNQAGEHAALEPVVPPELWAAAQAKLVSGSSRGGRPTSFFLLGNGMLRCGRCGTGMRVRRERKVRGGWWEAYTCDGRESGASECDQPAVQRALVDAPVLSYFQRVGVDIDAMVAERAGELDRRRAELDERIANARREAMRGQEEIDRLEGYLRGGRISPERFEEVVAPALMRRDAALAALDDIRGHAEALQSEPMLVDAERETLLALAELRAAVAGEIASSESVRGAQAALRRVFSHFVLHDWRSSNRAVEIPNRAVGAAESHLMLEPVPHPGMVIGEEIVFAGVALKRELYRRVPVKIPIGRTIASRR